MRTNNNGAWNAPCMIIVVINENWNKVRRRPEQRSHIGTPDGFI